MPRDHHAATAAVGCAGDDRIGIPGDLQVIERGKSCDDRVSDGAFVSRDRFDVTELPGDSDRGCRQVDHGNGGLGGGHAVSL